MNHRVHFVLAALVAITTIITDTAAHRHWNNNNNFHHGRHDGNRHQHHHHHHRHGRWYPSVVPSFEIYEPKGLEVYIADRNQTAEYVAIAVFINAANTSDDVPAVLQNTSTVVYGKFIVQDSSVIIKPGDIVSYKAQIGYQNGKNTTIVHRFLVRYDMIRRNCTCDEGSPSSTFTTTTEEAYIYPTRAPFIPQSSVKPTVDTYDEHTDDQYECEIDPRTNLCKSSFLIDERFSPDKLEAAPFTNRERQVLEGIIDSLQTHCASHETRTNYMTLAVPSQDESLLSDPVLYVQQKLSVTRELQQLVKQGVRLAQLESDTVLFEMRTALDKLKLLYLCKEANIQAVQDYDFSPTIQLV